MIRRLARPVLVAALTGALVGGSVLAGAAVRMVVDRSPTGTDPTGAGTGDALPTADEVLEAAGLGGNGTAVAASGITPGVEELAPEAIPGVAAADVTAPSGGRTPEGTYLVGAARASLSPAPEAFGGETWRREGCAVAEGEPDFDTFPPESPELHPEALTDDLTHMLPDPSSPPGKDGVVDLVDEIRSWPATPPDCVYLGGFGIGPLRYAERVGDGGVWMRAMAISNGEKTFVYGIADTVGWFAEYDTTICDDCGIRDVRERLAGELGGGVDVAGVVIGSTHTHAGADTYGGWGGIPDWYRAQLRDAAVAAAKQAVANLRPATLDVGEAQLRQGNNERRDTYYSTVDTGATWIQARELPVEVCEPTGTTHPGQGKGKGLPGEEPVCHEEAPVIATLATYAAHPTIVGDSILHADWPGAAARRFEAVYGGGVGLMFEGGLGNASVSTRGSGSDEQRAEATGIAIADEIAADIGNRPQRVVSNDMAAAVTDITHPALASNPGLVTLASVGLFDRAFAPGSDGVGPPAVYHWSKEGELSTAGEDNDPEPDGAFLRGCTSSGPSIVTTAGAHRIGDVVVAFTPGEIFSNIAEVVKERADGTAMTMVFGQTNDALGYIIQSFEFDETGNAVTEYGTTTGEYEEVFAIDRCFGDHVLETLLESTAALGAGR